MLSTTFYALAMLIVQPRLGKICEDAERQLMY